jgi:hypothetical protein
MAQDSTFKDFVDGRAKYRDGVVNGTFPSYDRSVGPADPTSLLAAVQNDGSVVRKAATQNAADMLLASQRAVDMRKMSHRDYIDAYKASAGFMENYDRSRLDRFGRGQV